MSTSANRLSMPDIAAEPHAGLATSIDWVGMNRIEIPVRLEGDDGAVIQAPAEVSCFVDLVDGNARGIHMSRLYLHLDRVLAEHPLTPETLKDLLEDFLQSHAELSTRALVRVDFDYLVRRPALASDNSGWRSYPFSVIATLDPSGFGLELGFEVTYSSTCPCSAALARQLIQQQFASDFDESVTQIDRERVLAWLGGEQGIVATPHAQRSVADVRVRLNPGFERIPFIEMIDCIEGALKTPVQTAVKREDEQEFARLNGQNLMFCEDAARRVKQALDQDARVADYWARCSHFESLHPHDAVAIVTKGVPGGYQPIDSRR
ncbi:MAG: GTP cyclohydrolase FolE2 [Wenzhouxiangellaceae bacterium]